MPYTLDGRQVLIHSIDIMRYTSDGRWAINHSTNNVHYTSNGRRVPNVPLNIGGNSKSDFSINNCSTSIEILNGSNYGKWKQNLEFSVGITDLDLALCENKPVINDDACLNRRIFWITRKGLVSDNAAFGCLMKQLTKMRYDNTKSMREFIMKMVHIQTKLKSH
ncbi:hypothetical protein CR513_17359, partial [Mucuna pruriens]